MLRATNMLGCKTMAFPFPKASKLCTNEGDKADDLELYRRLRKLYIYLNMTRPDISYVVQQLSQILSDTRVPHLNASLHVLRYRS